MSNGLTDVFLDTLTLAGTALAESDHHRDLIVWFAAHDQTVFGRGMVGFDLVEIPITTVEKDREFLDMVCHGAASDRIGWEFLSYQPNNEWLTRSLNEFVALLTGLQAGHVDTGDDYRYTAPVGHPRCVRHPVLLHRFGCRLCNYDSTNPPQAVG